MHPTLERAFKKKLSFLLIVRSILLIDCPVSGEGQLQWLCFSDAGKKPRVSAVVLILAQLPFPSRSLEGGNSPYLCLPFPGQSILRPREPGSDSPGTCQELNIVFFLPQDVLFLGTAAVGC